ncbi:hypothetical protein [Gracilimonas sp.]|uniref:hypothetical protein n=1 Tax=Gracilimonas sp. TaxID=1974203 RepID=UPI003BAACE0C
MITKQNVREIFDSAETTFNSCWDILANIKENEHITHDDIISFQPNLAKELFQIDKLYHELSQERNYYIGRKNNLSTDWFENRLKKISVYQKGLKGLLSTGLMLGDSFAWIFYAKNRDHLSKHYQQGLNIHFPPGIGGIGELEFISKIPIINNHIVIYHELTSFLRLGDVSLINMEDFSLTAIGELKSSTEDGETVNISFTAIAGGKDKYEILENDLNNFNKQIPLSENRQKRKMPHKVKQRLERQVNKIGKSLNEEIDIQKEETVESKDLIEKVSILCKEVLKDRYSNKEIDQGLLLFGFKNQKRSLFSKFLNPVSKNYLKIMDNYADEVLSIMKKDSSHNYLFLYEPFKPDEYFLEPGMIPLFHWPLDIELIRALIFKNINLISTYNPVNLIEKLKEKGFDINEDSNSKYGFYITKKLDNNRFAKIEGFFHLLRLIGAHFFSEDSILEMLLVFDNRNEEKFKDKDGSYAVDLYITQNFGDPP